MAEKRKTKTSSAVKAKYNKDHYRRLAADMKISEFKEFESLRGDLSRPDFIRVLIAVYKERGAK